MISQELPPDPPFWTKTSWIQIGYASWVNLTVVGIGLSFGFSAVATPQLLKPGSAIELTFNEEAMIASMLTLFSPIGCMACGILMDRCGRKPVLILCHLPTAVGWLYTGFAENAMDLIIGRIITGVGIGMAMVVPRAYITEISLPNMRGTLGAFPNIAISCGVAISAGLGAFMKWYVICWIYGVYAICIMFSNCFLPETPFYIIVKGDSLKAKNALKKFRSSKFNTDEEFRDLTDFKANNYIHKLSTLETISVLLSKSSCKPFCISFIYVILMQTAGVSVVMMWTVDLLERSKSSIDANLGNFAVAVTRIICGFTMSACLFKFGRRSLALISALGLGCVSILLGMFLQMNDKETPYSLCFFIVYIAIAAHGYYTLPFLMMFEMLPLQTRGILSGMVLSIFNLSMCGINHIYPTMREKLGLAKTFFVYGSMSLIGFVILYFILPETKGLTLQEIEEFFNARRATLISERRLMSLQIQEQSLPGLSINDTAKPEEIGRSHRQNRYPMVKTEGIKDARYKRQSIKEEGDKGEDNNKTKTPKKPDSEENASRDKKGDKDHN